MARKAKQARPLFAVAIEFEESLAAAKMPLLALIQRVETVLEVGGVDERLRPPLAAALAEVKAALIEST